MEKQRPKESRHIDLWRESPAEQPIPYLRVTGLKGLLPFQRSGMFAGFHGGMNRFNFQRRYNPHHLCHERSYRLDKKKRDSHWLPVDVVIRELKRTEETMATYSSSRQIKE